MTNIYPAIDLLGGKCVRLTEGVYGSEKIYSKDPVAIGKSFEVAGFKCLHIVDLDGAKSGSTDNLQVISEIIKQTNLKAEVGGGIRDAETIKRYLDLGVDRVILGSAAIKDPAFLATSLETFGEDKIVLGLDVRDDFIYVSGWEENSGILASEFLLHTKAKHILMTDISKDGKLEGPNFDLYKKFAQEFSSKSIIASGGIAGIEDVQRLIDQGCEDIIVGKAIYEGRLEIEDLVKLQTC